ncbi:MAG: hypothetical protein Q9M50_06710 [Methylococcales bacterium]|nr:hypothetical protein [Methylococcales bacterium]
MSEVQKIIAAVIGCFVAGFLLVGNSKEKSIEELQSEAMVRAVSGMSRMASKKCPVAIKKETGTQVYFASETDTDKETYVTMKWVGGEKDNFKMATCTLHVSLGGISKLVIDDKVLIDKDV